MQPDYTKNTPMMKKGVVISHPACLLHDPGPEHVEIPERLQSVWEVLQSMTDSRETPFSEAEQAPLEIIEHNHPRTYIDRVRNMCLRGDRYIDSADTGICVDSYDAALYAAGAVIAAGQMIASGEAERVFCPVRPPGHHAEAETAMGFCLFNNIAIGARYLYEYHDFKRIYILDWDVHHGNGTQHVFEETDTVFFCSIHQSPLYPGTGEAAERGKGTGEGYTLNCPVPPGTGDREYQDIFQQKIAPSIHTFQPDCILISAGFDAHRADPLANITLSTAMFGWMTEQVVAWAEQYAQGRVISVLEGGYNLNALQESVKEHLNVLFAA